MRVTLSAAVSADGFLDDNSPQRLILSTREDWAAVERLRLQHDAILVGAETLRRDDPRLAVPGAAVVTITRSARLDASLRFFAGDRNRYIFSPHDIPELKHLAEVISTSAPATARQIVTQLEKRGIRNLLVEGGAQVLRMFLGEGMADTVRLAVNPAITLAERGYAPFAFEVPKKAPCIRENLGGMLVTTCTLHADSSEQDRRLLDEAIRASHSCTPSRGSYCVGAVVVTPDGQKFTGYTHQTSTTHHAEQEAIAQALAAGAQLRGAALYSSMEPCSQRSSEPESCTELILRHGFSHVAFALYEPAHFVDCRGALTLREAGVDVRVYPELGAQVEAVNAHLLKQKEA